jgi:hypothetical protein
MWSLRVSRLSIGRCVLILFLLVVLGSSKCLAQTGPTNLHSPKVVAPSPAASTSVSLAPSTSSSSSSSSLSSPKDVNICVFEWSPLDDIQANRFHEKKFRRFVETGRLNPDPFTNLKAARLAVHERRYAEADEFFLDAMEGLNRTVNDTKLDGEVLSEYARYLKSRHRDLEAKQILGRYKSEYAASHGFTDKKIPADSSLGPDTFEKTDYPQIYGARSLRRPKSSPTLPEGTPVPDNE